MRTIRALLWLGVVAVLVALAARPAAAAESIKVGLILPYSGPFARLGETMDNAVKLWVAQNPAAAGGIEIIRRDETGPNPDTVKRLAQELIQRDHVQIITGLVFTPNALAVAPLATEAKVPVVIMNAATAVITTKSPYLSRVSLTLPQTAEIFGRWAATKGGAKRAYTAVSDYGPGHDADAAFQLAFKEAGGTIVGSVRYPVVTPDFVPFLQRVLDENPDALYAFIPGGTQPPQFVKTFDQLGLKRAGIRLMPSAEAIDEADLQNLGDLALGLISATNYTAAYDSPTNKAFVGAWKKAYGEDKDPDLFAVDAWDGMALIADVVKAAADKFDGDKAMTVIKAWKHESPRGPISIDPETRDIVQNIYICEVKKVGNRLANVVVETYPAVKDPWKERNKQ